MPGPAAVPPAGGRVSTLELFFDLVFVFTVTQVATVVEHHLSWKSVAQATVELVVIYWMYGGFAWLTNSLGSQTRNQRIVLLTGMAAFLVVSLAVPRAFGEDGVAFGIAYLALNAVHLAGFLLGGLVTTTRAMVRIGTLNVLAAVLILVAGLVGGDVRWVLWLLAVAVQWLPALSRTRLGAFDIDVEHFAERHGLMIIIVLGESVVSVASGAQEIVVNGALVIGTLCGLASSGAMWWCYFDRDSDAAAQRLADRRPERRGRVALLGYDLPHVLMMAGVVAVAAGARLALPDLIAPTSTPVAGLLAGGAAVYLAALALFRFALGFANPLPRLVGAAVAPALMPLGTGLGAAYLLAGIAALLALVMVVEAVVGARPVVATAHPAG